MDSKLVLVPSEAGGIYGLWAKTGPPVGSFWSADFGQTLGLLLFIGNYVMIVLVRANWTSN